MFISQHVEFFLNLSWYIGHALTLKDYSEKKKWSELYFLQTFGRTDLR